MSRLMTLQYRVMLRPPSETARRAALCVGVDRDTMQGCLVITVTR